MIINLDRARRAQIFCLQGGLLVLSIRFILQQLCKTAIFWAILKYPRSSEPVIARGYTHGTVNSNLHCQLHFVVL